MKLLVTGGAGYIGSVVTAQLLDAGHEVVVLDNLSRGHGAAIPAGAALVQADLLDADALEGALSQDFDAVMHFAALAIVVESVEHPERYWRHNVAGTLNLLDAMRAAGLRRLVFSSTCAVYGEPERVPMDERTPTAPTNPYGASKLACDMMIGHEAAATGLAAISLRYFNVAGASGERGQHHENPTHIIPNALRAAAGVQPRVEIYGTDYPTRDGSAVRDFIHVEDLANAHLLALDGLAPGEHRIYNLGNGRGFSVREVVEAARRVTGREFEAFEAPRRAGDPPELVAASERIRADLGWKARKPELETMIADAWEWMLAHPNGYDGSGAGL